MYNDQLTQQDVNQVAKYIYNKTEGAYKIKFGVNQVDVYMFLYYHDRTKEGPIQQMDLDINLTSYQGKIRCNVTEMTSMENTILHTTITVKSIDSLETLESVRSKIYDKIIQAVEKEFVDYDIVY